MKQYTLSLFCLLCSIIAVGQSMKVEKGMRELSHRTIDILKEGNKEQFKSLFYTVEDLTRKAERLDRETNDIEKFSKDLELAMAKKAEKSYEHFQQITKEYDINWEDFTIDSIHAEGRNKEKFDIFIFGHIGDRSYGIKLDDASEFGAGVYKLQDDFRVSRLKTKAEMASEEQDRNRQHTDINKVVEGILQAMLESNKEAFLQYAGSEADMQYMAKNIQFPGGEKAEAAEKKEELPAEKYQHKKEEVDKVYEKSSSLLKVRRVDLSNMEVVWDKFYVMEQMGLQMATVKAYLLFKDDIYEWKLNLVETETGWIFNYPQALKYKGKVHDLSYIRAKFDKGNYYRKY